MGIGGFLKKAFTTLSGIGTVKAALGGVKKMAKGDFKGGLRDTILGTATGGVMGSKKKKPSPWEGPGGDAFKGWMQQLQQDPNAMQNPFLSNLMKKYQASQGAGGGVSAVPGGINPAANQGAPLAGVNSNSPLGQQLYQNSGMTMSRPTLNPEDVMSPQAAAMMKPGFASTPPKQENAFGNPFGSYGGQ